MSKILKIYAYIVAPLIIVGLIGLAVWLATHPKPVQPSPGETTSASYTPAIPRSKPEAQPYLDQAAEAAQQGDYKKAVEITDQAINEFPDDENFRLNRDVYQLKAIQNGQM